ncbi:MAG: hypothetical protein JW820_08815 [Spirochaetales bacterium]|nr:hypothetical protein [Spirochaetales bacterium]
MAGKVRARMLLLFLLGGLLAVPARGDELEAWFAADPRATAYADVRSELKDLFAAARLQSAPMGPLVDKLREGAAKGVDGERLVEALRVTIGRLVQARTILEQASGTPAGAAAGEEDVQGLSLLLLRGLPEELARGLIARGVQAGREMQSIRAACGAVISLTAVAGLDEQETLRVGMKVGTLLLAGALPVSSYEALAPVYLKARAAGLENGEILEQVIIASLEAGGGIVAMDEKINRGQAAKARKKAGKPPDAGPPKEPPGQAKDKDKDKDKDK